MSTSEKEISNKQMIYVDVAPPLVNNMQVMSEQQKELGSDNQIDLEPATSGGIHDYILCIFF